jgi:hypothetical protein
VLGDGSSIFEYRHGEGGFGTIIKIFANSLYPSSSFFSAAILMTRREKENTAFTFLFSLPELMENP